MLLCLEVQPGTIFTEFALGCPGDPLQGQGAEDTHPLDSEGSLPLLTVVRPVACLGQARPQPSALGGGGQVRALERRLPGISLLQWPRSPQSCRSP